MALKIKIPCVNGVVPEYFQISDVGWSKDQNAMHVNVRGYLSAELRKKAPQAPVVTTMFKLKIKPELILKLAYAALCRQVEEFKRANKEA